MLHKRLLPLLTTTLLALGLIIGLHQSVTAVSTTNTPPTATSSSRYNGLTELLPGHDYITWYSDTIRPQANRPGRYFGAYKFEPIDNLLYIGFGSGRPADEAGSLLAVSNGSIITPLHDLDEEGFIDMMAVDGTLYIPGPDPHYGDSWAWGNFYIKAPGQPVTKYRNLPNVIHTWGAWYDTNNDILYTAVSSHLGDNTTWTGEVFSSTDQAQTWTRVGNRDDGLGDYRTYDIIGRGGSLYAVWMDYIWDPCGLAHSDDGGLTWTRLTTITETPLSCRLRQHIWQDSQGQEQLLSIARNQKAIVATAPDNSITTYPLTDYRIPIWSYNALTNGPDGYLYAIAEYGQIIRTNDLVNWELIAHTDLDLFTIAYWPERNELVVGERINGRIWTLDLTDIEPIPPSPPPAQYVILLVADGWGANHIAAATSYSGQNPPYHTWPRYWISTYAADGAGYDSASAWSDFDYVRSNATDSAAAATALYTGHKTTNGRISVDPDGNRLTTISERAQEIGMASGAVSSVYLSHATPGAWIGHNDSRLNGFAIADEGLWGNPNTTGTITDHIRYGGGHGPTQPQDVLIGTGHPNWRGGTFVNTAIRDKLYNESGNPGAFVFVERLADSSDGGDRLLAAANDSTTTRLVGLFGGTGGNLEYRLADGTGHNPENPTLAEMTTAALTVLERDPNGFVLMVEGGAIDWASHSNNMDQMIGEMLDFNEAVQAVVAWVEADDNDSHWANTLVIVTGDHETGYLTGGPGVFPQFGLGGAVTAARIANEKVISGTQRRASWDDANNNDLIDPGETVYWAWNSGQHTNMLIPIYAQGTGAARIASYANANDLIRGAYLDNTDVFHIMALALPQREVIPITPGTSVATGNLAFIFDEESDIDHLVIKTHTRHHPEATHAGLETWVYWELDALDNAGQPAANFTTTITVTVPFTPGPNDKLCRYANSVWDCGSANAHTHDTENKTITRHNVTQFSEWTVGRSVGPTAVSLANIGVNTAVSPFIILVVLFTLVGTAVALVTVHSPEKLTTDLTDATDQNG